MNFLLLSIIFSVVGIVFGLFMVRNAALIIKIHIETAAKSNWRTEPISMEKELKDTKIRGIRLAAVCVLAIICIKLFIS